MPTWYLCGNERFRGPVFAAAAASYAGPGDVVASALGWWGLRAYNAAAIGVLPAIRIQRDSDNTTADIGTIAGGGLDFVAYNAFKGVANVRVDRVYDQTGNGFHIVREFGTPAAFMPEVAQNEVGGTKPALNFNAGGAGDGCWMASAGSLATGAMPFVYSMVWNATSGQTSVVPFAVRATGPADGPQYLVNNGGNNTIALYAVGAVVDQTASNNAYHTIQGLFNSATSIAMIDGVDGSSFDLGATTAGNGVACLATNDAGGGHIFIGKIAEVGVWAGSVSRTSLYNNQHTYYGI